jgi:hypothetical protein
MSQYQNKVFFVLAMMVFGSSVQAQNPSKSGVIVDVDPITVCVIPKIDGDKVPFPLKSANTKFELAENETYILNGTLVEMENKTFFKVDFNSQPWLSTQKRLQFPYFLVDHNDVSMMKKYNGSLVQMAVVVRKRDLSTDGVEWDSSLVLNMLASPILIQK